MRFFDIPEGASNIDCWLRNGFGGEQFLSCDLGEEDLVSHFTSQGIELKALEQSITIPNPFLRKEQSFESGRCYRQNHNAGGYDIIVYSKEGRLYRARAAR